ncbi:hypothetical protein [Nocardia sp. alder85J]|uniref:hypothetical protein n=1 Tax=Nocardia sp. alder85J TaxID=2862949 RepID=UPI001CD6D84F|nr:hypothetical protein [Nocardia sp. alder85J]MCX4094340.1 hypothetical protein [Nocardia sp. alder85J]
MVLDILVSLACTAILTTTCWLLSRDSIGSRTRRGTRRTRKRTRPVVPMADPGPTPPAALALTVEWADPAQIWPALNAANVLLTARLKGRISADEYRRRTAELARRCEPQSAADTD